MTTETRKVATLHLGKALLDVSLTVLSALGAATGNIALAGVSVIPSALAASDEFKVLLNKEPEEILLTLEAPPWWSQKTEDWQSVCRHVERQFPTIMQRTTQRLTQTTPLPVSARSSTIRNILVEEIERTLPHWGIFAQERWQVADKIASALIEKSTQQLKPLLADLNAEHQLLVLSDIQVTQAQQASMLAQLLTELLTVLQHSATPAVQVTPVIDATIIPHSAADILTEKLRKADYDVYICYHEDDEDAVLTIVEQLKARGLLPWLAIEAHPGKIRGQLKDEQIEKISVAAIFVGEHAIEKWQAAEMYAFIEQSIVRPSDEPLPIIPVLLDSAPKKLKLPPLLSNYTWVDFRKKIPDPLERLIWGITGKRPGQP